MTTPNPDTYNSTASEEINRVFGNQLRIRVCGICFKNDSILLIKHEPLGEKGFLWAPPGGGMHFGEKAEECLKREILEETGLSTEIKKFLFVNEYYATPLHCIELFFHAEVCGGQLTLGTDPEMQGTLQIIKEVKFIPFAEIKQMDKKNLHNLFNFAVTKEEILNLQGYLNGQDQI